MKVEEKNLYLKSLFVLIPIIILFYYIVYPMTFNYYQKAKESNKKFNSLIINEEKNILLLKTEILHQKSNINSLQKSIEFSTNQLRKIKEEVKVLSFVRLNVNKRAEMLKNSVMKAIDQGLKLQSITSNLEDINRSARCFINENSISDLKLPLNSMINSYINCNSSENYNFLNKKLSFTLNLSGDYKKMILYIYSYENRKELFRVESLSIPKPNQYVLKIALYGTSK